MRSSKRKAPLRRMAPRRRALTELFEREGDDIDRIRLGASGTVFDIGYQSYTGAREGRGRSRAAVFKDGVRIALGLGRGARAKILPWFFIGVLSRIGLVMAMIAGAAERLGGPGSAPKMNLPSHSDFYGIASIILFVFAARRRAGAALPRSPRGRDQPVSRAAAHRIGLRRRRGGRRSSS